MRRGAGCVVFVIVEKLQKGFAHFNPHRAIKNGGYRLILFAAVASR